MLKVRKPRRRFSKYKSIKCYSESNPEDFFILKLSNYSIYIVRKMSIKYKKPVPHIIQESIAIFLDKYNKGDINDF